VAGEERRREVEREFEEVPRPIRVLAAVSAGILAAVLVVPAFVGVVRTPDEGLDESAMEWGNSENDMDKAEKEVEAGEDAGGEKSD
jgi:hypothetical protein